ncbi:MAG: extracellular solute-binding protein [Chloroflexi bacterium]|nr:MAG: extracellular solute-binding protein [Chloroflexota bacterium]
MSRKKEPYIPDPLREASRKYISGGMSRRDFLKFTGALGIGLSQLPGILNTVKAQEGVMSSADRAVEAAQAFAGETINMTRESGLQAQDPLFFSGPLWQELTGVSVNVIELDAGPPQYSAALQEHIAGSGAFDVIDTAPLWMPDYVRAGALEPLDDFIAEYMNPADLDDFPPVYKDMGRFEGLNFGIFDDGDTLLLYYRKDLFEEHADEFADELGYPLAPPTNWRQFDEIAKFFTERFAPDLFGSAFGRAPGAFWNVEVFLPHFKANGGIIFDPDSMDSLVNSPEGVRTVSEMAHSNQWMPPGITELTVVDLMPEWLAGNFAMMYWWPPVGRWSAGFGQQTEELAFLPESQVAGKTGYALLPGDITQMAIGFNLTVSSDSRNKELAYLFIQWLTSPEISLQRVTLPFALRDPYRISHFNSELYRGLWDDASDYLDTLLEAGEKASMDILLPGGQIYHDAIDRACTAVYAGADPQSAMDQAAAEMDALTDRLGREGQRSANASYLTLAGAYPSTNLVDAPSNLDM